MIPAQTRQLVYGNQTIRYELSYARRKTLTIRVHSDLHVTIVAPIGTALDQIEALLTCRASWILRKQRQYEASLLHRQPPRYVSGEVHRYLGLQYRLEVVANADEHVKLVHDRMVVCLPEARNHEHIKALLDAWYAARAREVLAERLAACFDGMRGVGIVYPHLTIRVMRTRWGSARSSGRMTLNTKLIQAPVACIDYVVFHELCHLKEPNHSPAYYQLLERVLPDWRERKARLSALEFG